MMMKIKLIALKNFPVIKPGDNISKEILTSIAKQRLKLLPEDIIVIAHKIVSISQGRFVDLSKVRISKKAIQLSVRKPVSPSSTCTAAEQLRVAAALTIVARAASARSALRQSM